MDPIYIEMLGFVAGSTNLASSVPQLIANIRCPQLACGQSAARNMLQLSANVMWFVYGAANCSLAMIVFSTLGAVMAALLFIQVQWVKKSLKQAADMAKSTSDLVSIPTFDPKQLKRREPIFVAIAKPFEGAT